MGIGGGLAVGAGDGSGASGWGSFVGSLAMSGAGVGLVSGLAVDSGVACATAVGEAAGLAGSRGPMVRSACPVLSSIATWPGAPAMVSEAGSVRGLRAAPTMTAAISDGTRATPMKMVDRNSTMSLSGIGSHDRPNWYNRGAGAARGRFGTRVDSGDSRPYSRPQSRRLREARRMPCVLAFTPQRSVSRPLVAWR